MARVRWPGGAYDSQRRDILNASKVALDLSEADIHYIASHANGDPFSDDIIHDHRPGHCENNCEDAESGEGAHEARSEEYSWFRKCGAFALQIQTF